MFQGNIIRVLNLWQKNNVFGPEVIQPLMDMADPNHPLHQEIQQQQNNNANGEIQSKRYPADLPTSYWGITEFRFLFFFYIIHWKSN